MGVCYNWAWFGLPIFCTFSFFGLVFLRSCFLSSYCDLQQSGHINAKLTFHEPVNIYWIQGSIAHLNESETHLGHLSLGPVDSKSARAYIDQETTFYIDDTTAFGEFTAYLINEEYFTWRLKSENVQAHALKFPVVNGLSLSRDVTIPGTFHLFIWYPVHLFPFAIGSGRLEGLGCITGPHFRWLDLWHPLIGFRRRCFFYFCGFYVESLVASKIWENHDSNFLIPTHSSLFHLSHDSSLR